MKHQFGVVAQKTFLTFSDAVYRIELASLDSKISQVFCHVFYPEFALLKLCLQAKIIHHKCRKRADKIWELSPIGLKLKFFERKLKELSNDVQFHPSLMYGWQALLILGTLTLRRPRGIKMTPPKKRFSLIISATDEAFSTKLRLILRMNILKNILKFKKLSIFWRGRS